MGTGDLCGGGVALNTDGIKQFTHNRKTTIESPDNILKGGAGSTGNDGNRGGIGR